MKTTCQIVIVDGLIGCGRTTLTRAIAEDLEVMPIYNGIPSRDAYTTLRSQLENPEPLVIDTFHLTAAAVKWDAGSPSCDLTAEQWSLLDDAVARRFGRIIFLVDTPGRVLKRLQSKAVGTNWTLEKLGLRLQHLNQAFSASAVARKSSYSLPQFISPETGEKTKQYQRLLEVLRKEMEL